MLEDDEMITLTQAMERGYATRATLLKAIKDGRLPATVDEDFYPRWCYRVCVSDLEHVFRSGHRALPVPSRFERTVKRMSVEEIDEFISILEKQKAIKLAKLTGRQAREIKANL